MAELTGNEILAKCLKAQGVKDLFFIMGGPMLDAESSCIKEGIRLIDTRHEQGAAYMAQAYSRVTQGPGVCMAASGPATLNFGTGLANALIDCCPVVALGGSSPISQFGRQVFQEIDQVKALEGCVKYADRVHNLKRLPQQVNFAFQKALNGKPGPVYLDFPGDVLYQTVDEADVDWSYMGRPIIKARPYAEPKALNALVDAINRARQPIIVSGSGVLWSQAWEEMRAFVEKAGIPFYTTPQGRGVVPDDHPYSYLTMRNDAFREADLIIILGTRTNYVIGHAAPPRFSAEAKIARIEIDPEEMGTSARNIDIPVVGDCKSVLTQLVDAIDGKTADRFAPWRNKLHEGEIAKRTRAGGNYPTDGDIHPLRLCEEIRNFMQRDAILSVDGQEILNFGRQSIPTFVARPSAQFRPVRHDGRRAAVRGRRQGRQAQRPGHLPARRRLLRAERDGARHRGQAQIAPLVRDQPQRRLDRRPGGRQARPLPRLHALRQDGRSARLLRGICRTARGHPPGPAARVEQGRGRHGRLPQRQDRLSRPRHNRALLQPRNLTRTVRATRRGALGRPFF